MNYPSVGQYTETIKLAAKAPEDYFEKLSNLRPVLDANGEPIMSSGNFAVVFKMVDESGKFYAARCFHREQDGREQSYKKICSELEKVSSPYILPIKYLRKELFVDSDEYPVLLMDWVDGVPLNKFIRQNINDSSLLRQLSHNFKKLSIWLLSQPFAHGDLKPDNILVKQNGSLVLVDYDGMFVPSMKGETRRELGSPDFQNPHNKVEKFDENIDLFSLVSIFLSLSLIANDSDTLVRFGAEDRLLFSANDYLYLQQSKLFNYIINSFPSNGKIRKITDILYKLCKGEPISLFVVNSVRRILTSDVVYTLNKDRDLPSAEEYINTISNFAFYFRTLEHLKIITENNRVVYVRGANSVVFKMQDELTEKYYAIKCYTDVKYDIFNRLEQVKTKLNLVDSPYLVKFDIIYNEINISVNDLIDEEGIYFPVIIMDWVDGVTLDHYHPKSEKAEDDLKQLISSYKSMSSWLLEQNFSHGDISPKNVIVTKDNNTLIIDYDNMVFSDENAVPVSIDKMRDVDFCNPSQTSFKYEDNIDNFSLVSIMISLIYQLESTSKPWKKGRYFYGYFLKKEDYTDIDNSNLFKSINEYLLWDSFVLCLKQQLRSTVFSKEEINYLFKDRLSKAEDIHPYRYEGPNARLEKRLVKFASAYSVLAFIAPFILISYTGLNLLSVSIAIFISSIVFCLLQFTIASFRPDKKSTLNIRDDRYVGFGCLGSIGIFMPVLFMSDLTKDLINNSISWLHIPTYNEPWYITVVIWFLFFLSNQLFMSSFMEEVYDYDTLIFDIRNKKYTNKREKFIDKLSEDEYNYNNSKEFKNSRLLSLIIVNIIALMLFIYTLYFFYFLHLDLIYTNTIIALLSLGTTFLVQPILKDEYAVYSRKLKKMYWNISLTKVFLPMITIPFAFDGFTEFLNSIFSISIPPYELGMKEFIINAILYILIYCFPFLKAQYV